MAVTASGLYGLTLEKIFIDTAGETLEAEDNKTLLVTNSETPNFDTHDFRNDITAEVSGTGYTAGGAALTTTEITLSSGTLTFDAADSAWASSTITAARAAVHYFNVGSSATDMLVYLINFGADVSTSAGTLTIQYAAGGIFTLDYTP
jgi:hypothetical protein